MKVMWTVSGRIYLFDQLIQNARLDSDECPPEENPAQARRTLSNVLVKVYGSRLRNGGFRKWGETFTDDEGSFSISEWKNQKPRRIKVVVEMQNDYLTVSSALGTNKSFVAFESTQFFDGPTVDLRQIRLGSSMDAFEDFQRANIFYVANAVMKHLDEHDLSFDRHVHIRFPGMTFGSSWAGGNFLTPHTAHIRRENWSAIFITHEMMHLWSYQHNTGFTFWPIIALDLFNPQARRVTQNVAMQEGFAEYAGWELIHLIWGQLDKPLPFTRNRLQSAALNNLTDIGTVERNWLGVMHSLRFLTAPDIYGIKLGGTTVYAEYGSRQGCDEAQFTDFYGVLRAFQGFYVGPTINGLSGFLDRCHRAIAPLRESQIDLLWQNIDPTATSEMSDACPQEMPLGSIESRRRSPRRTTLTTKASSKRQPKKKPVKKKPRKKNTAKKKKAVKKGSSKKSAGKKQRKQGTKQPAKKKQKKKLPAKKRKPTKKSVKKKAVKQAAKKRKPAKKQKKRSVRSR